jgi:hypothetical protein
LLRAGRICNHHGASGASQARSLARQAWTNGGSFARRQRMIDELELELELDVARSD